MFGFETLCNGFEKFDNIAIDVLLRDRDLKVDTALQVKLLLQLVCFVECKLL